MTFRISGRLSDGQAFSTRVEAANAIGAVSTGRKLLADAGHDDDAISSITAAPLKTGNKIHIGAPRTRKASEPSKAKRK